MSRKIKQFCIDRKKAGIYKIINLMNNKIYVGSAISIRKRWNTHIYDLLNDKHHSILLQRAWNKYGEDSFKFEIIEFIEDKTKLIEREQYWMDYYKSYLPENGYNVGRIAGSQFGFKHSEETKKLMSKSHTGKTVGHKGPEHSEEFKQMQRERLLGNTINVGRSHPNPRKGKSDITKNCLFCYKEFSGPKAAITRKKYCSAACFSSFWRGKHYNV